MKYVMLENTETGSRHAVVFGEQLIHSVVAHGICREYRREGGWFKPISAGFTDMERATGESESLSIGSDPSDIAYIVLGDAVSALTPEQAMVFYKIYLTATHKHG